MEKVPRQLPNVNGSPWNPPLCRTFFARFEKVELLVLKKSFHLTPDYGLRIIEDFLTSFPRIRKLECEDVPLHFGVGEMEHPSPKLLPGSNCLSTIRPALYWNSYTLG